MSDPWDLPGSPLKEGVHKALWADRAHHSRLAGIDPVWINTPLSPHVGEKEVKYITSYRALKEKGIRGILYTGSPLEIQNRLALMAGTLIRNFIDARVRSMQDLRLGWKESTGDPMEASVLMVPDFCTSSRSAPEWKQEIAELLVFNRASEGKQTLLFAPTIEDTERAYSETLKRFLDQKTTFLRLSL